jgi:hypothetical protein
MIIGSQHAIQRYRERVENLPDEQIIAALSGTIFKLSAAINSPFVKLPSGHRAVIRQNTVITVLQPMTSTSSFHRLRNYKPAELRKRQS